MPEVGDVTTDRAWGCGAAQPGELPVSKVITNAVPTASIRFSIGPPRNEFIPSATAFGIDRR
jgi:hypothetical protein